ncbi:unnamed protein product [Caenorhabditis angaria]|uniref:Uncharacterized protein n=1 Tax=Caenorhabditis angaria TaxID=860376 RepID=A0A9P1IU33_9PELO|nr:unnamed protein product [Caenorhabditis angaria]
MKNTPGELHGTHFVAGNTKIDGFWDENDIFGIFNILAGKLSLNSKMTRFSTLTLIFLALVAVISAQYGSSNNFATQQQQIQIRRPGRGSYGRK